MFLFVARGIYPHFRHLRSYAYDYAYLFRLLVVIRYAFHYNKYRMGITLEILCFRVGNISYRGQ